MVRNINILIVDDHPFIIEAYKNAIKGYTTNDYTFSVTQANDCKSGYEAITDHHSPLFDIGFFDISMPQYAEKNIFSGEDLAKLLKSKNPGAKIILLTMHTELLKINSILKSISPNGLIIKNDLTFDELLIAFDKILSGENYYSQTVGHLIAQIEGEAVEVDSFDKQILYHLSKGTSPKDLLTFIPLTEIAIEKRKLNLKNILGLHGGTDIDLIKEARLKGLF